MEHTCTIQGQSQKQKDLPFLSQHHDQFEAVQAAAQLLQAQDEGGSLKSETKTVLWVTPAEVERRTLLILEMSRLSPE